MKNLSSAFTRTLTCTLACAALAFTGSAMAGTCPGDLDGDGNVSVPDLMIVLHDWGCASKTCAGDATGDGLTDPNDLILVLTSWGACGSAGCTSHADCDDGDACTLDFCINGTCFHFPFPGPGCN